MDRLDISLRYIGTSISRRDPTATSVDAGASGRVRDADRAIRGRRSPHSVHCAAVRQHTDYTLARRAVAARPASGARSPASTSATPTPSCSGPARNVGEPASATSARSAAAPNLRLRLLRLRREAQARPTAAASRTPRELAKLGATHDEFACYVVEVCLDCRWNHLRRQRAPRPPPRELSRTTRLRGLVRVLRAARDAPQLGLGTTVSEPACPTSRDDVDAPDEHELVVGKPAVVAARRQCAARCATLVDGVRRYPARAAGSRACPGRWRCRDGRDVDARVTAPDVAARKGAGTPLVMVTAYDAPSARVVDAAGVDMILVGDSLAMVVLGYDDTLQVTIDDMAHHVGAVARTQAARARRRRPAVAELPRVAATRPCATRPRSSAPARAR